MAGLFEYGIGGNEVKPDASEALNAIPENRTLICQKLTDEESLFPETAKGLTTVEEVFRHFKPNIDVSFEDAEGSTTRENIAFRNVGDFTVKKLTEQSPFLTDLNVQQEQYSKITKQLKTNKVLRTMLETGETREAFVSVLQALIAELQTED